MQTLLRHGYSYHPLYHVWRGMKVRCTDVNNEKYKNYGGRGISIYEKWLYPMIFIEWALENGWDKGLRLDRIDNDGDYTPENCRFVSPTISSNNQRLLRSNNTTGYRGIAKDKRRIENPYVARITRSPISTAVL